MINNNEKCGNTAYGIRIIKIKNTKACTLKHSVNITGLDSSISERVENFYRDMLSFLISQITSSYEDNKGSLPLGCIIEFRCKSDDERDEEFSLIKVNRQIRIIHNGSIVRKLDVCDCFSRDGYLISDKSAHKKRVKINK